ncbi:MAG: Maf-like protein [Chlamydiota bacterium]|jgi:septum formation protein
MPFILGSGSPRRKEILSLFKLPFIQVSSGFNEDTISFKEDPAEYAKELSIAKAKALSLQFPTDPILTADTVVFFQGKIFNKPLDKQEAFFMLKSLSGKWHQVFTAVSLYYNEQVTTQCEQTKILMHTLSDEQIQLYHAHDPCLDKAGAYAIQGSGGLLVEKIEGCYYNVMGLPIHALQQILLKAGIDLWHYLK